jgi:hypothetical protein
MATKTPTTPAALGYKPLRDDTDTIVAWVNARGQIVAVGAENRGVWGSRYVKVYHTGNIARRTGEFVVDETFDRFIDAHRQLEKDEAEHQARLMRRAAARR